MLNFFAKKLTAWPFKKLPNWCVMDSPIFDPFIERLNEMTELTKFVRWIVCLNLALLCLKLLLPNFFYSLSQYSFSNKYVRVNVQGVKSLGGHFACLCREFDFYEVKRKKKYYYFSNTNWKYFYTLNHFYSEKSSKRAK